MVRIESNAQWQARIPSSVTWARIEGGQSGRDGATIGVGNGELRIFCEENPNQQDRTTAIVIMAGTRNPKQCVVVIEQQGTGVPEPQTTVGELYSLYVTNKTAEFHYSFVSDDQVEDYGLVYSRDNDRPSRDNSEMVVYRRAFLLNWKDWNHLLLIMFVHLFRAVRRVLSIVLTW